MFAPQLWTGTRTALSLRGAALERSRAVLSLRGALPSRAPVLASAAGQVVTQVRSCQPCTAGGAVYGTAALPHSTPTLPILLGLPHQMTTAPVGFSTRRACS